MPPRTRTTPSNEEEPTQNTTARSSQSIPTVADDIQLKDEEQFALWSSEIIDILQSEYETSNGIHGGLVENATSPVESMVLMATARTSLILKKNMTTDLKSKLINMKSPQEIWDYVVKEFSGKNPLRMNRGIFTLTSFRPAADKTMDSNINDLDLVLFNLRTAAGSDTITYEDLAKIILLYTLPKRFEHIRHEVESKPGCTLTAAKQAIRSFEKSSAFAASLAPPQQDRVLLVDENCSHGRKKSVCWTCDRSKHPRNAVCKDCNKKGHRTKQSNACSLNESKKPKEEANLLVGRRSDDFQNKTGFCFATKKRSLNDQELADNTPANKKVAFSSKDLRNKLSKNYNFVLDSGCTTTLVQDIDHIGNLRKERTTIGTASKNGQDLKANYSGSLNLSPDIILHNVLFCPEVSMNLVSVSQLCDLGLVVVFDDTGANIRKKENNKLLLRANRKGNLYYLNSDEYAMMAKKTTLSELAHRRLMHINHRSIRLLKNISTGLKLDAMPENCDCEVCKITKSRRATFQRTEKIASRVGERVYIDLSGRLVPSLVNEYEYYMLIVDDFSRHVHIYFLRTKDEAYAAFWKYAKLIHNKTGRHIQTVVSDGGGEFINVEEDPQGIDHGITHITNAPYTPEKRARVERINLDVKNGIISALRMSGLPDECWEYAAATQVYCKNRSPHAAFHRETPYFRWHDGELPDLSHLRVFGTVCYAHVPKEKRKALDEKARKCVFVGYSETNACYILLDLNTHEEVLSSSVEFGNEMYAHPEVRVRRMPEIYEPNHFDKHYFQEEDQSIVGEEERISPENRESAPVSDESNQAADKPLAYESDDDIDPLLAMFTSSNDSLENLINVFLASNELSNPTFTQAMKGPHKEEYLKAIRKEYQSIEEHQVFSEPCMLPPGKTALDTKMVLKEKPTANELDEPEYKARLCVRGFLQKYGIDFHDTHSPVAAFQSLRLFIDLMAKLDYEMDTVDVKTAFLYADLKEEIYIRIPDGYPNSESLRKEGKVLRLLKSLYGLKQAPAEWNRDVDTKLNSFGFSALRSEPCIYVGKLEGKTCYILVYVDDLILATPNKGTMADLKSLIRRFYTIKDNGPISFYLNLHFLRNRKERTIAIHQTKKIRELLSDYSELVGAPSKLPARPNVILTKDMCPSNPEEIDAMKRLPFRNILGRLLHICITARPDIAFAVNNVGRFASNPGQNHFQALIQILKYLKSTQNLVLLMGGKVEKIRVHSYSDSDWAGDIDQRRSRSGFSIFSGKSLLIWASKLQSNTAKSTVEAEYNSLSSTVSFMLWVRNLLGELGFAQNDLSRMFEDNKSCIDTAKSGKNLPGTKHIDIAIHFIRDHVDSEIEITQIASNDNVADFFTKALSYPQFMKHRESLRLVTEKAMVEGGV